MNAVVGQVDPADLRGICERILCDLCDVVILQIQVVGPERDDRDHTDVPVLAVEGVGVARGAQTLSRTVRVHGRGAQDDRGKVCGLLGLWLSRCSRPGVRRLPGGGWALRWLLWPRSLGRHCLHQEEQSQSRDESRAGLHGPMAEHERKDLAVLKGNKGFPQLISGHSAAKNITVSPQGHNQGLSYRVSCQCLQLIPCRKF